jgi:signal transduction histidine kinase
MRERATLLGGTLNVTSTPGAGTLIRASIPLHTGGDDAAQRGGGA